MQTTCASSEIGGTVLIHNTLIACYACLSLCLNIGYMFRTATGPYMFLPKKFVSLDALDEEREA